MRRHRVRASPRLVWWLTAAGIFTLLLLVPAGAAAHAVLVSSQPTAGQQLGTTPGVVSLSFSEPLNPSLSKATVTDPSGRQFAGTASGARILVPLSTNTPGTYHVAWTSVSSVDNHTLSSGFDFGVAVARGPAGLSGSGSLARSGVLLTAGRTVEDTALLLAIGMLVVGSFARADPRLSWVRPRIVLALGVAAVSGVAVVLTEAVAATSASSAHALATYLTGGASGVARCARLGLEIGAVAAACLGSGAVWILVLGATVALAAAGHAAAIQPAWWGIALGAAHILAAGVWAGGILTLATLRPPGGWRGPEGSRLVSAFSPVALGAFLATVALGAMEAFQEVGSRHALTASHYGQVLLVKMAVVAAMVPLSLLAWRARRAHVRPEAALAVSVIGLASLMSAFPAPAAIRQATATGQPPPVAALPTPGPAPGLTMGSHAGSVLVGLTLKPAAPGANQALVYLLPLQGEQAAAQLQATLRVGTQAFPLTTCGPACRQAPVPLQGGEVVTVTVAGPDGGTATFQLPPLPAPDATSVLASMSTTMHKLATYRSEESLSSGQGPGVTSTYLFQAPDRLEQSGSNGSRMLLIGGTRYLSNGPGQPWDVQVGGPPPVVPSYTWDFFKPFVDAKVIGQASVDGVPTQIVSFFGSSDGSPAWFQLWIDAQGVVRQAAMRAQGHVMDDTYSGFDTPTDIVAPAGASSPTPPATPG